MTPSSCPIYDCVVWPEAAREDGKDDEEAGVKVCYALVLPTATRVRKIGSTTVVLNVGVGAEASIITCQLSHTAKTVPLHAEIRT